MSPEARAAYGREMFARFEALDRALVAKGFPATSPWWRETVRRYFESDRRQVVLRVGRRGGKSSTLSRVGVVEALYGRHQVPPGDLGVVAVISVNRDEASQRLRTIKAILDALGVRYRPIDGGIELEGYGPRAFKVYTASISGVSGFTAICVICDEAAKWKDADTGANPAKEVLASVRPTMATMPLAKIVLSSSPLGKLDAHAAAFDAGDDDFQIVAFAPTWVANPTITEADTRALERDEARRLREYGAVPMEGDEESLLTTGMLDKATRVEAGDLPRERGVTYVAAMDPAFVRNAWTLIIAGRRRVAGRVRRAIVCAREWRGTAAAPLNPETVLTEIAKLCGGYGVEAVDTDRYEKFSLQIIGQRAGIHVRTPERSAGDRLSDFESLATLMADGEIEVPPDKQLRADLLSIRQRLTPNGFTIHLPTTPDGRHCDYAPSACLALTRCRIDPEPAEAPSPTIEQKLAAMRAAEERRWQEVERRGDESVHRQQRQGWLERMEEDAFGSLD